ncbi:MAG: YncE family protein [Candidatus Binatia bacterium]|nr:YncE family protein [Candidatus Binatia bacterium]
MPIRISLVALVTLVLGACSDQEVETRPPLLVTADWLNRSLTVFAQEPLLAGSAPVEDAILGTVDLSAWPPGPVEVEITPDGETAIVAVGPGFFQSGITNILIGSPDVPNGSAVLLVDLESLEVTAEISTRHAPLGIAITPDGARAYTANYGLSGASGDSVSVIDIAAGRLIEEFSVGGRPEQIAIDPDGRIAIVNLAGSQGGVQLFSLSDPTGTLSDLLPTGNDPSDVTFLQDSTRAIVANSFSTDFTLLDTSNPAAPVVVQNVLAEGGAPYGVTYLPGRDQILAPTGVPAALIVLSRGENIVIPSAPLGLPGGPFPLVGVPDSNESHVFVPHMSAQSDAQMSIVDLDDGGVRSVRWLETSGPAYIATWP